MKTSSRSDQTLSLDLNPEQDSPASVDFSGNFSELSRVICENQENANRSSRRKLDEAVRREA